MYVKSADMLFCHFIENVEHNDIFSIEEIKHGPPTILGIERCTLLWP